MQSNIFCQLPYNYRESLSSAEETVCSSVSEGHHKRLSSGRLEATFWPCFCKRVLHICAACPVPDSEWPSAVWKCHAQLKHSDNETLRAAVQIERGKTYAWRCCLGVCVRCRLSVLCHHVGPQSRQSPFHTCGSLLIAIWQEVGSQGLRTCQVSLSIHASPQRDDLRLPRTFTSERIDDQRSSKQRGGVVAHPPLT